MDTYAAAQPPRLPPGTRLNGMFEIDQRIASGGMGEIYRGHVIETGDAVAIKMMRLDLTDNAMALALFRKEASALHNIHHEAIIRYYVFSHDPGVGRHYLAMEFVDGLPLSDLLQQGPLGLASIRMLQERLAAGLSAAHELGIIHRDLSPDNVLIPGRDLARAKIIDFGIARSTRSGDGTIIGSGFAGKYNYVSPEQLGLFGGDVTPRSDIYSLGLVLAACVLGRPLDMGGTQFEVLEKRRVVPDLTRVDSRFRPLLEKMLQPNPADRPESMAAVAAWRPGQNAARGRRRSGGAAPPEAAPGSRRLNRLAVVIGLFLGIAGGGLYFTADPAMPWMMALLGTRNPPPPPPPPPEDPTQRIIDFVNSYDRGGDCFFIAPEVVDRRSVTIDGLGREGSYESAAPFYAFSSAFEQANGFEADIIVHQVRTAQCPAVDFLYGTRYQRDAAIRITVATTKREDGAVLMAGAVSTPVQGSIALLRVPDDGYVYNLAGRLESNGATRTFEQTVRKEKPGPLPQLLIAIASPKPLRIPQGALAAQVFPQLLAEAQTGQPLHVRAKYFILGE